MIGRIKASTPVINDARYLIPILPIVILAMVYGLMRLQERRWLYILANIVILCFILMSLIFHSGLTGAT